MYGWGLGHFVQGGLVDRRLVDRTFRRKDFWSTDVSSKGLLVERFTADII